MSRSTLLVTLASFLIATSLAQDVRWSRWGKWTKCTRSCGGGITQRERICNKHRNTTEKCQGTSVEYSMCNIQDCPDGTPDFRMQQCAEYNKKLYKGKLYKWAGFAHRAGECELKCMPKNEFFYVTFKDKVIDGTPCNDYSLDVCINGTCQPVGCDNQLFSDAEMDKCGVCRGDGSSCTLIKDTFKVARNAFDYVHITTIPVGSTRIVIRELGQPKMYLALTTTNGANIINGDHVISSPGKQKYDGSVLVYERNDTNNTIRLDGPNEVPLEVKAFIMDGINDISFEYNVPGTTNVDNAVQKAEYFYVIEAWGKCSKRCATGSRQRSVYCADKSTRRKVPSFNCDHLSKPRDTEECNTQACPARWYISQWAPCSTTCGRGLRTRRVHCVRTQQDGNIEMLDFSECHGEVPKTVEVCVDQGSCPKWIANEWTECSRTCGEGYQKRLVECMGMDDNSVDDSKCNEEKKPINRKLCYNPPCGATWKIDQYGGCSSECGKGLRIRIVTCVNSKGNIVPNEYCNPKDEPQRVTECVSSGPCKPQWRITPWSKCSARCGSGVQVRSVYCTVHVPDQSHFKIIDGSRCSQDERPLRHRRCYSEKPCHVSYFVSNWGKCSVTCGMGIMKRTIRCYTDRKIDHSEKACSEINRPNDYRMCNLPDCPDNVELNTTDSKKPVVLVAPIIVSLDGPNVLNEGENADFICRVTGQPRPKISWYMNDREIKQDARFSVVSLSQGSKLVLTNAFKTDNGKVLSCSATNVAGVDKRKNIINVHVKPTAVISRNVVTKKEGERYVLTCYVTGQPTPRVQWHKDGDESLRNDGDRLVKDRNTIIFSELLPKDAGKYECIAFNSAGSATSTVTLKVESSFGNLQIQIDCKDQTDCSKASEFNLCDFPYYQNHLCCDTCRKANNSRN